MEPGTVRVTPGEDSEPLVRDADEAARLKHYHRLTRQLNIIAFGANALGAALITVYFNLADRGQEAEEIRGLDVLILVAVLAGVMILGSAISARLTRPMTDWQRRAYTTPPDDFAGNKIPVLAAFQAALVWIKHKVILEYMVRLKKQL